MSTDNTCKIFGQTVDFSFLSGTAIDIQNWSSSHARLEGGGGWIHPTYGGYIQAPSFETSTTQHLRVRIKWDNGTQSGVDLPGDVHVSPGDRLIMVAGENRVAKLWHWAGVLNVTTNEVYGFGATGEIVKARGQNALERIGFTLVRASMMSGQAGVVMYIIFGAIISAIVAGVLSPSGSFLGTWIFVGIVFGAVSAVGFSKALKQLTDAPKAYNQAIWNYLHSIPQENLQKLSAAS
ncbi:hypothetical protein [Microvirga tunisiensis]|uniref:Uncharacterized protein n=1 Tax=Microvirga tunisiensis TaxID=2108360 RepID=A0A5N7MB39_9HYPH|nr:hypothetical protein [Microvirga tunisiensis]MPR08155.1 hypothetical protein [Microvirga tunisiensis]MPR24132.1 hypothetical protein [Microvirga tunisiensis]